MGPIHVAALFYRAMINVEAYFDNRDQVDIMA